MSTGISAYPPSVQAGIPRLGTLPRGWSRVRLGDLLRPVYRPIEIIDDQIYQLVTAKRSRGGIVARERLPGRGIKVKDQYEVRAGDFVLSNRQISHGGVGLVPPELNGAIVSGEYTVLEPCGPIDLAYLSAFSHSVYFQQICFHSSIGVHVEKLVFRLEDWLNWQIDLPPPREQRRITDALATWDRAIEATEALTAAKRQNSIALTQRFSARYHSSRIEFGELVHLSNERITTSNAQSGSIELENLEAGTGRILGLTPAGSLSGVRNVFRPGDTLFGKLRPYLEKYAAPDFAGMCSTEIWVLRPRPDVCAPEILPHLLRTVEFRSAASIQSGSRMPRANWEVVEATPIPCPPSLREQRSVALPLRLNWLATQQLTLRAEALRTQRRGMLQKLLTGDQRLRSEAEEAA